MNKEKYQGYSNRSTWLAVLHLINTNEEVYKKARAIGQQYIEMLEYWHDILSRDPHSYSYPFHQMSSIEKDLLTLVYSIDAFRSESDCNLKDIKTAEVLEAINDIN